MDGFFFQLDGQQIGEHSLMAETRPQLSAKPPVAGTGLLSWDIVKLCRQKYGGSEGFHSRFPSKFDQKYIFHAQSSVFIYLRSDTT